MIQPTVGRVVWYWPGPKDNDMATTISGWPQPFKADVVYVHDDRLVNLMVVDHSGTPHARRTVRLLQDDDAKPDNEAFAVWMPYQKAVAKGEIPPTIHARPYARP
jgi:hypothetical protein